jgi:hypothetical protein
MKPINLFDTPSSWTDLEDRLQSLSGDERSVATLFAMLTWNLACKIANEGGEHVQPN